MNEKILEIVQNEEHLYPHALEKQYPRILGKIIELWDTPEIEGYLLDLMVDRRGGRQGFPKEVAAEIYHLDRLYERRCKAPRADNYNPWTAIDIKKQQEIEGKGYSCTPQGFLKSAEAGNHAAITLFLSCGLDVNTKDERGWTPLMISSFNGNEEIAELLIRGGADIEVRDNAGYGPMHWAAFNGYHTVIRLLLEKRADPNALSNFGWTPLMQAATRGHLVAAAQLIGGRANVNLAAKDGWTALHKAAANNHTEVVKLLLSKGADANMQYQDGSTALSIAAKNRNEAIIALLKPRTLRKD